MKTNSFFKEGLFFVMLITVMIVSVGIGIMSLASASSSVVMNDIIESQTKPRTPVSFSKFDKSTTIHMAKVSLAINNYRKAIIKSGKARTSVMAVYWKIEAADSLSVITQSHFDSIKSMLNVSGDELQTLAQPKNISALADNVFGKNSVEKQDRKIQMNKILNSIELNLNQLASN